MNDTAYIEETEISGHIDMKRLGELLINAADLPSSSNDVRISLTGVLSNAARTLNEFTKPLNDIESDADVLRNEYQERIERERPAVDAFFLEEINRHFAILVKAVNAGDAHMVSKFFNRYIFD